MSIPHGGVSLCEVPRNYLALLARLQLSAATDDSSDRPRRTLSGADTRRQPVLAPGESTVGCPSCSAASAAASLPRLVMPRRG